MRYHGDAQEGDRSGAGAIAGEVADEITEVTIVDDTGRTYLAEVAPVYHWSLGSFETGSVDLDAPEIVAAAAGALLAVGALPNGAGLAVPLPLQQAIAVVENISAYEDLRAHDGTGSFWFWPPVPTQAKQLRVIVSTRWEAAWALIDIPGR